MQAFCSPMGRFLSRIVQEINLNRPVLQVQTQRSERDEHIFVIFHLFLTTEDAPC